MAKINRKKLARGTKLLTDHTHAALSSEATKLSAATVAREEFETPNGTFRINLSIPELNSSFVSLGYSLGDAATDADPPPRPFAIPFTLVPFQEFTQVTAPTLRVKDGISTLSTAAPRYYLDEISFSFDQRAEPGAIADRYNNTASGVISNDSGRVFYGTQKPSKPAYDIRLSITEKSQVFFDQDENIKLNAVSAKTEAGREVWSFEVGGLDYNVRSLRPNPLLIEDINVVFEPYKTYVFMIQADGLAQDLTTAAGNKMSFAMPNIMASLKFRTELTTRDTGNTIQNIPSHNGAVNTSTVTVNTPAAGASVPAEGATGLSTNMATLDDVFRERLSGGYTQTCEMTAIQRFADDSCYDVIAVPLMQNRRMQVIQSGATALEEPYIAATGAGTQILADRRIIPITDPMTIHHVILGWNWQICTHNNQGTGSSNGFYIPETAGFTVDVGVGLGTGLQSDRYDYRQIASHSMVAPDYQANAGTDWYSRVIDRISSCQKSELILHPKMQVTLAGPTYVDFPWWDMELHQVPIVGSGGAGYYSQGKPVFVGKGRDNTQTRSALNGSSTWNGDENFLEVRMTIKDTSTTLETSPTGGMATGEFIYSGYQGHFVYLLCKKSLK
jgi:hypothetical protein